MLPKKYLGQHFLKNKKILEEIARLAELSKKDIVLEIGPGHGELTEFLAQAAGKVIAVEKDRELIPFLEEKFKNQKNVKIISGDILKIRNLRVKNYKIVKHSMFDTAKKILGAHAAGFPAKAQNAPPFPRHKKQTPGKISNQAPPGAFIQRLGGNLSKICAIIKICITGQQMKKLSRKTAKITQLGNLNS